MLHDICLCASTECSKYNECLRGDGIKREGIFTQSYLAEVCNEENNYKCFIEVE